MLHSLIANGSSERTVCRISHTHWYGCTFLLFRLIANSSNGLTVWPESHTQLKSEPCLMHPPSQTFCIISDGFHTTSFAIIASHTVSRRVSDRSVALAASYSSVGFRKWNLSRLDNHNIGHTSNSRIISIRKRTFTCKYGPNWKNSTTAEIEGLKSIIKQIG